MDVLMLDLSKSLGVTVDTAVEMYPELKTQMSYFQIFMGLDSIVTLFALIFFACFIISFVLFVIQVAITEGSLRSYSRTEDFMFFLGLFKVGIFFVVLLSVCHFMLTFGVNLLAPDIIMIKSFYG